MNKKERSAKIQQEDAVLTKVLIWFGGAVTAEFLLLLVNRFRFHYRSDEIELMVAVDKTISVLAYVSAAALVVGLIWLFRRKKAGGPLALPVASVAFSGFVAVTCWSIQFLGAVSVQVLQAVVPALAVLALIYYLYQKEFFCITASCGLAILGLWLFRKAAGGNALVYIYMAGVVAVLVLGVLWIRKAQRSGGVIAWRGGQLRVFERTAAYPMVYLSAGLSIVALAAALGLGAAAAYYAIFALVAWLFVMAVYHTVRLM